jgi:hypothetical protein
MRRPIVCAELHFTAMGRRSAGIAARPPFGYPVAMSESDRDDATVALIEWCRRERAIAVEGAARYETGQAAFGSFISGHLVHRMKEHSDSLHRMIENMDRIIEACERRNA